MSKRRYEKVLDKVREHVTLRRDHGFSSVRVPEFSQELGLKESIVAQCFSALIKEKVLESRTGMSLYGFGGHSGKYPICGYKPFKWKDDDPFPIPSPPKKQKVSWGSKRRILTFIRKTKPWVVEQWHDAPDNRWFMYMEEYRNQNSVSVDPQDQPDLARTQIEKWHFDMDGALQMCGKLRRQHPTLTFRVRDTSAGDYVMGAIL